MAAEPREFGIIRRIVEKTGASRGPLIIGPGDDAAVVRTPRGKDLVFTTDTLSEGVHFKREWLTAGDLGWKAVAQSLSDVAAMGAEPLVFCTALSMPRSLGDAWIDGFTGGLMEAGEKYGCMLAGGNLSRSPSAEISVTVSMLGTVRRGRHLLRSGARKGDLILLTGWPGLAAAGLADLSSNRRASGAHVDRFRRPVPGTGEIAFLMRRLDVHALMDTSDGVFRSLAILAESSGVKASADARRLPLHKSLLEAARRHGANPAAWASYGGEDFDLMLAVPPPIPDRVLDDFACVHGRPLSAIGAFMAGAGAEIRGAPAGRDFEHF